MWHGDLPGMMLLKKRGFVLFEASAAIPAAVGAAVVYTRESHDNATSPSSPPVCSLFYSLWAHKRVLKGISGSPPESSRLPASLAVAAPPSPPRQRRQQHARHHGRQGRLHHPGVKLVAGKADIYAYWLLGGAPSLSGLSATPATRDGPIPSAPNAVRHDDRLALPCRRAGCVRPPGCARPRGRAQAGTVRDGGEGPPRMGHPYK